MADKAQEVAKQELNTKLSYYTNEYTNLMTKDFAEHGVNFDDYSKQCVMASMSSIFQLAQSSKLDMSAFNGSNLRQIMGQVASLKLNANAIPRECYFSLRKRQNANGVWEQVVELGIEGDGNDALLRQHGVNVKQVHPCWLVKEGDEFTYPQHKGLEVEPPTWNEKGLSGKVVRVVYPVELKDGKVVYLISERDSVKVNLIAHIRNNMMNETFGICKNRYQATDAQKKQIAEKKEEIMQVVRECETLEDILASECAKQFISAAWLDTPEAMFVRKMRNNAIKKFPKDLNSMASVSLLEMDETYKQTQEEIADEANSEEFIEADAVDVSDAALPEFLQEDSNNEA